MNSTETSGQSYEWARSVDLECVKRCPYCGEHLELNDDHHGAWLEHKDPHKSDCFDGQVQLHTQRDLDMWNSRYLAPTRDHKRLAALRLKIVNYCDDHLAVENPDSERSKGYCRAIRMMKYMVTHVWTDAVLDRGPVLGIAGDEAAEAYELVKAMKHADSEAAK